MSVPAGGIARASLVAPIVAGWLLPAPAHAQEAARIALTPGLTIVHTLHGPDYERESQVAVAEISPTGVRYVWSAIEVNDKGDTLVFNIPQVVADTDLAGAPRLHLYAELDWTPTAPHRVEGTLRGPAENPGYTSWSISTDVYRKLLTDGSAPISIMSAETRTNSALAGLGIVRSRDVPVRWRGTLTRVGAESFPLLIDGRRVRVPAVRVRGQFTATRGRTWKPEMWVMADSAHPLLLRVNNGEHILQVVRIDRAAASIGALELSLDSECRVELPGIYFGFNSAVLDSASDATITRVATMLARHPQWTITLEGHTDSIGGAQSNQLLSQRRADAVRARLTTHMTGGARTIRAVGYGASRPREPNTTIEGRARNRRVELVRDCEGKSR
jgi:outer membrane protein OmpA-like peptidoglycan-associated protein